MEKLKPCPFRGEKVEQSVDLSKKVEQLVEVSEGKR